MMKEMVSAIITTHNRLNLLKRAVESVQSQTYKKLELIVVDNHSDDETKDWCHCGKRIEYVHNDGSITYKDTLLNPNHGGDMSHKILTTICTATTSCILALREALVDVGLFDENLKFWQEYELTIRLAQRSPFYFVNEPLVVYRVDIRDGLRLTKKYFEWKESVSYIHKKHAILYPKLSFSERMATGELYHRDAKRLAFVSGVRARRYYHALISKDCLLLILERLKRKFDAMICKPKTFSKLGLVNNLTLINDFAHVEERRTA